MAIRRLRVAPMRDEQTEAGWWKASDGRLYPPEQHPDYAGPTTTTESHTASPSTPPPFPAPPHSDEPLPHSGWSKSWPWLAVSAAGLIMLSVLAGLAAGPDDVSADADIQEVRSIEIPTTTERIVSTTTTAAPTTTVATTTTAPPPTTPPPTTAPPPPPTTAPPPPHPPPPTTAYVPPPPPPAPVAAPVPEDGSVSYKNCDAARAAGAAPVLRGDPGYGKHLDRDGDGIGCEN